MLPGTFWGFLPGDKRVVVVGLGRSGRAAATLLKRLGHEVFVSEREDSPRTRGICGELRRQGVNCELGRHSPQLFGGAGLIVVSPGARADLACLQYARERGIRVIPEIELAASLCPAKIIAVTGTNGKSTTVSLIAATLRQGGKKAHICGNIGNPFSGEIGNIGRDDIVCLEVSSFQLETIDKFRPYVAVILNISANHLNRHRDIGEYLAAKKRIFSNQGAEDWLVLNKGDLRLAGLRRGLRPRIRSFSGDLRINGVFLDANEAAALSVAGIFGVSRQDCLEAFRGFGGLKHRLEFVANIRGVDFIDDSKSTTVASLAWALRKVSRPVVLIAGGRDKGGDFSSLRELLRQRVKALVVMGEAREKIRQAYEGVVSVVEAEGLSDAVRRAAKIAEPGDCVLLSPMCASFDMFESYEQRGRAFKEIVCESRG